MIRILTVAALLCLQVLIMRHILHNVRLLLAASVESGSDGSATSRLPLETPLTLTDDVPSASTPARDAIVEYQSACYTSFGQTCQSRQQGSGARPSQDIDADGSRGLALPALGSQATPHASPPVALQTQTGPGSVAMPSVPSPPPTTPPMAAPVALESVAQEAAPAGTLESQRSAASADTLGPQRSAADEPPSPASMLVEGSTASDAGRPGGLPSTRLRRDGTTVTATLTPVPASIEGDASGGSVRLASHPAGPPDSFLLMAHRPVPPPRQPSAAFASVAPTLPLTTGTTLGDQPSAPPASDGPTEDEMLGGLPTSVAGWLLVATGVCLVATVAMRPPRLPSRPQAAVLGALSQAVSRFLPPTLAQAVLKRLGLTFEAVIAGLTHDAASERSAVTVEVGLASAGDDGESRLRQRGSGSAT